jgi:sigma54-dependent transcription regulator
MVSCKKVIAELSNYLADAVDPKLRMEIEDHLRHCRRCSTLLDSTRKVLLISGDERTFEVPLGYSERLHRYLDGKLKRGGGE